ncbi:MAG TPA: TrkA family potassium uptake protein [Pirellulaceae bacterium]|jgi:trk system potassium uptake protein TrkA|nr:TrkA family potassium uptake protein [Pirellulaceae bacterium]
MEKHIIVIGLGSFGTSIAKRLSKNGVRVTGMDASRERVEALKDELYEAVIGDATQRAALEQLPYKQAMALVISLGEDITRSILAALHARELGARQVVVKGVTADHGKILRSLGVDRVIFPETEIALQLADRLTWPNVVDYLAIDPEYSIVEIAVPDSFAGKTLQELNVRRRFGISVLGLKDALTGKLSMFPEPSAMLGADQILLVVGNKDQLARVRELE